MSHILDTDTYIYLTKGNKNVLSKVHEVGDDSLYLTSVTVAELYFGAFHSRKINDNLVRIQKNLEKLQILNFNKNAAKVFGRIKATLMHDGKPIDDMDLAIASIALSQGFTLVTHNTKHFKNIPELLLEDWES